MKGKKHGKGKFAFNNGDMMDCDWNNGKPNGTGIVIENGEKKEVTWNQGALAN